ncbi:MAG: DinB family protein [bacterium JZ-2024 1]
MLTLRDFFPFWEVPRRHAISALVALGDEALDILVRPGGRYVGDVLRHILAIEEGLLMCAILGERYETLRPSRWSTMSPDEKVNFYRVRFGDRRSIIQRLEEHTRIGLDYLMRTDAGERNALRKTPWGTEQTIQYIFWHLEEHLIHHRAQIYLALRASGFPAPEVT